MPRVAGTDPGTSSLDVLVLQEGRVEAQHRFLPGELTADPAAPVHWLESLGPFDLVAGPSGYGLPLLPARSCGEPELDLMTLVRPDERGQARGVTAFSTVVRTFHSSRLPVVFLPGVLHLPTVPVHRKYNRIDLGTPDKLCVAALALAREMALHGGDGERCTAAVIELGTAFTACVVLQAGRIVDGLGGTCGPVGWESSGAWDGEAAYLLSPLTKEDLFSGGAASVPEGPEWLCESLRKSVAGLRAVTPFERIYLSGRLLEIEPQLGARIQKELSDLGTVVLLESLEGAWVKQAAQGAALAADGLAGGGNAALVERLQLRAATGTVLDWLRQPRIRSQRAR